MAKYEMRYELFVPGLPASKDDESTWDHMEERFEAQDDADALIKYEKRKAERLKEQPRGHRDFSLHKINPQPMYTRLR